MTAHDQQRQQLTPTSGAAMGMGAGAVLAAATGDGTWIGLSAGFGAVVALLLNALCRRPRRVSA